MWVGNSSSAAARSQVRAYGAAVWRARWALGVGVALCAGAAFAIVSQVHPRAVATVRLLLEQPARAVDRQDLLRRYNQAILDDAEAQTQLHVILSDQLLDEAFEALNPPVAGATVENGAPGIDAGRSARFARFRSGIAARRVRLSYVIEISAAASTLPDARRAAASVASAYMGSRVAAVLAEATKNGTPVQERIERLRQEAEAAAVAMKRGDLPDGDLPDSAVRLLGAGEAADSSAGTRLVCALGLAASLGLVGGLLLVAFRQRADRRLGALHRLRDLFGLRNLTPGARLRGEGARRRAVLAMRAALGAGWDAPARVGVVAVGTGGGAALAAELGRLVEGGGGPAGVDIRTIAAPVPDDAVTGDPAWPALDAAILLVDPDRTTVPALRAALEQLRHADATILGTVTAGRR